MLVWIWRSACFGGWTLCVRRGIAPSVAPGFRLSFLRCWLGFVTSEVSKGSSSWLLEFSLVVLRTSHFGSPLAVGGYMDGGSSAWLRSFSRLDLLPLSTLDTVRSSWSLSAGGSVGVPLLSALFFVSAVWFLPFRVWLSGLWFAA